MQSKQYTIGEFAAISKISTRMLRHYDKIGLFKPVTILPNGYRAYSSGQIATLSLIRQYQSCGFTLSEIGNLLPASKEQIQELARKKQWELRTRDAGNLVSYNRLCSLMGEPQPGLENDYALSFTLKEETLLLLCEDFVPEDEIESSFDKLYHVLENIGIHPAGLPILLAEKMGDAVYRTSAPIRQEILISGFTTKRIPAGWYLSTLHFGDYGNIGTAYDCLLRYADEHKRNIVLPFMERYLLDRVHTASPSEYITEISVKITP